MENSQWTLHYVISAGKGDIKERSTTTHPSSKAVNKAYKEHTARAKRNGWGIKGFITEPGSRTEHPLPPLAPKARLTWD